MSVYKVVTVCRVCNSSDLHVVMQIEEQFISQGFVRENPDPETHEKVPQTLILCKKCGLVQLKETVNPDILYKKYYYRSAINDTMRRDLKEVVSDAVSRVKLNDKDIVVDIGANDGTMIQFFPEKLQRIGVEPAQNISWENVDKSVKIVNDYFSAKALIPHLHEQKVKIFTCCAMFYDLDNPNAFVADIKACLAPDGIWCIQLSYLVTMLKNVNFYDICNEHLEYYSLQVLKVLMERNGLKVIDASLNAVNGGSARVFVTHADSPEKETAALQKLCAEEEAMGLLREETYRDFQQKVDKFKDKVRLAIKAETERKGTVMGLGASTKGNMLLQTFGITKEIMPYISERNPEKVGLRTLGTDFELISEDAARKLNPSLMIVLPWYFKDEIVKREQDYLKAGGKLLFPMPVPHIVTFAGEEVL